MKVPQIEALRKPPGDPPTVLVLGGTDPGGGAGLLRDLATAAVLGARAEAIETAWTEQGPGVHRVVSRDPAAVGGALRRGLRDLAPAAVKIGMAVGPATAAAVLEALAGYSGPIVIDPVLATTRGGALWTGAPGDLLPLLRRATLVTPNAPEAAALAGQPVGTAAEAEAAARRLLERDGLQAVLLKGGHIGGPGGIVTDVLVIAAGIQRFDHPRLPGPSPRGTGCALATAIAVELARGRALGAAVGIAVAWLGRAIAAATPVGDERHLPAGPS